MTIKRTAAKSRDSPHRGQKVRITMKTYYIRSLEQAKAIIAAYERCGSCDRCTLHTAEGWRCSYLYECAVNYIKHHDAKKEG